MNPGRIEFETKDKTITRLADLIETSCAPVFFDIQTLLGINLTSEKIIEFAEENNVKDDSVQLAIHICEVLLKGILSEQKGVSHIHTTRTVREKINELIKKSPEQLDIMMLMYEKYELPIVLRSNLLTLAKEFLEQHPVSK